MRRGDQLLFVVAVVVHLLALYWPEVPTVAPVGVPHLDKLVHVALFAGVGWTGARAGVPLRWLLPVLVGHAIAAEWVQGAVLEGRSSDVGDVVANLLGTVLGVVLARVDGGRGTYSRRLSGAPWKP